MTPDGLPLVVFPSHPSPDRVDWTLQVRASAERYLSRLGSILFRGFRVQTAEDFRRFAGAFGQGLVPAAGSEPLGVTELGHVRARNGAWPLRVWFQCENAPSRGDATWLADGREVFRSLPKKLRARFIDRGLMQVQRFALESAKPDRVSLEAWCRSRELSVEWCPDGSLRTRRRSPVVIAHPLTHELVWFNHAHRRAELEARSCEVVYADGTPIEQTAIDEVRAVFEDVLRVLPWEFGDVLLVDNLITSHRHVAGDGQSELAPATLRGEPCFSLSGSQERLIETPRLGPRRAEPAGCGERAPSASSRPWA
jgi:alpha-ketoglutarate-dependent taurine dioxygenase